MTLRDGDDLVVSRPDDEREHRSLHGLTRSLVANMVVGVSEGFTKELEIVGVGYRAAAAGPARIDLQLGFSHPVHVDAPEGVAFEGAAFVEVLDGLGQDVRGRMPDDTATVVGVGRHRRRHSTEHAPAGDADILRPDVACEIQ